MLNLPFNKWTLKFIDSTYEPLFEDEQNKRRLILLQFITICYTIVTVLYIFFFIFQNQPMYLIIISCIIAFGTLCLYILSRKIISYLRHLYSVMYLFALVHSTIYIYSGFPMFAYGFNCAIVMIAVYIFSDNRLKIIYMIATPFMIAGMQQMFYIKYIQWHILMILCSVVAGLLAYILEYTARLAFALQIISNKQKEIIYEFTNGQLIGLTLDKRTQQFQVEFQNKQFEINLLGNIQQFLRGYKLYENDSIQQGLEEYLFNIIKNNDKYLYNITCIQINEIQKKEKIQMTIKKIDYCKPLLILHISHDQVSQIYKENQINLAKHNEQMKKSYSQILQYSILLQQEINTNDINLISCLNLQIITQIRNFLFINIKDQLPLINKSQIELVTLQKYLIIINNYCTIISRKCFKEFKLISNNCEETNIKMNITFLTQILLNLFTEILKCNSQSIILTIIKEHSNNESFFDLGTIKFEFFFLCNNQFKIDQQSLTFQIIQQLLRIMGPTDQIQQIINSNNLDQQQNTYMNKIVFNVYSDQSQLDISFMDFKK